LFLLNSRIPLVSNSSKLEVNEHTKLMRPSPIPAYPPTKENIAISSYEKINQNWLSPP